MDDRLSRQVDRYIRSRHKQKYRTQLIRCLALLVAFATVYALIMPAITLSNEVVCGLEAHTHSEGCYQLELASPQPELVCGAGSGGETLIHTHDSFCYDERGELICALPQLEAHAHTAECYQESRSLICQELQELGHTHAAACFAYDKGELICGQEEGQGGHTHSDGCYPTEQAEEPVCGREEGGEHTHEESCFTVVVRRRLKCGLEECAPEVDEEGNVLQEGHAHTAACWMTDEELRICGQEEGQGHTHGDGCWDWAQRQVCAEEEREPGHIHGDECYESAQVLACQRQELIPHAHGEGCYDGAGTPVCGLPETGGHQHSQECVSVPGGEPEEIRTLVCGLEEHRHVDSCYVEILPNENDKYFCGREEHLHGGGCYFESGALCCTLEEHMHTAQCLEEDQGGEAPEPEESENPGQDGEPKPDPIPGVVLEDYPFVYEGEAFTVTYHISGVARLEAENLPDQPEPGGEPGEPAPSGPDDPAQTGEREPAPADEPIPMQEPEPAVPDQPPQEVDLGGEYIDIPLAAKPRGMASNMDSEPNAQLPPEDGGAGSVTDPGDAVYNSVPIPGMDTGADSPAADGSGYVPGQDLELDPALLEIRVVELTEDDPRFQAILDGEAAREEEPILQQAIALDAVWNGMRLDLSQCEITAVVKPTHALLEAVSQGEAGIMSAVEDEIPADGVEMEKAEAALNVYTANGLEEIVTLSLDGEAVGEEPESRPMALSQDGMMLLTLNKEVYPDFVVRYVSQVRTVATDFELAKENAVEYGETIDKADYAEISIIDTSGKQMPKNGVTPNTTNMYVHKAEGTVLMRTDRQEVYRSRKFNYSTANKLNNIDIVTLKGVGADNHYKLAGIQVRYRDEGSAAGFTGWTVKTNVDTLQLTNRKKTADNNPGFLYLEDGCEVELIYEAQDASKDVKANFYDYDVSDGKVYASEADARNQANGRPSSQQAELEQGGSGAYIQVGKQGINSTANAGGSQRYAFGNSDGVLPTGWGGISINKANAANFQNCSFGIVSGMKNGDVVYSSGITGPSLFAGGPATGKTLVNNVDKLTFRRAGDTYTLTSAGSGKTAGGLDRFQQMEGWAPSGKPKPIRYYNSFWPMDMAETWGADGHDIKFGGNGKAEQRHGVGIGENKTLPKTDNNGPDHNSYFGMTFELTFDLPNDYVGPLEYYFFGDDDMWVFLDGKLVCDIGGVHTAVGEYVDLWDYIGEPDREPADCTSGAAPEANSTKHTLTFFYVERGASGSTCWMQYTLPSVTSTTYKAPDTEAALHLEKEVVGTDSGEEFEFAIQLTDGNGDPLSDLVNAKVYKRGTNGVWEQVNVALDTEEQISVKLVSGQSYIITGLPPGTRYTITEKEYPGYVPEFKVETHRGSEDGEVLGDAPTPEYSGDGRTVSGQLSQGGSYVVAVCTNRTSYVMPSTGGAGPAYTVACVPLLAAGILWYKKRSQGEGAEDRA